MGSQGTSPNPEILPPGTGTAQQPVRRTRPVWTSCWATYLLVGINCAVFVAMLADHVNPISPTTDQLLHFGADNAGAVLLAAQWWRIVTAMFVHVGILHLATNMWCLWNLGLLGEPLLGPFGLVAVYLLTGIAGNLLSTAMNVIARNDAAVGAGASGAVFGIAGILIVLLSNRRLPIPWEELRRLRRSVIQFAVLNLVIGGATIFFDIIRIDNMAHLGGFFSGLALGGPLAPRMTLGRQRYLGRQKITFGIAALLLALFGYWIANLR
jgi:rhomboid protease GluP